jgi:hypothetical protein
MWTNDSVGVAPHHEVSAKRQQLVVERVIDTARPVDLECGSNLARRALFDDVARRQADAEVQTRAIGAAAAEKIQRLIGEERRA